TVSGYVGRRLRHLPTANFVGTPPWRVAPSRPPRSFFRSVLRVARLFADESSRAKILQRLLDLRARVHHERTVAGDRLAQRARRREEKPAAGGSGGRFDHVAIAEHDERGRVHDLLAEAHLAVIHVGERRVAARDGLAERGAGRQHDVDELRRDGEYLHRPDHAPNERVTRDTAEPRATLRRGSDAGDAGAL